MAQNAGNIQEHAQQLLSEKVSQMSTKVDVNYYGQIRKGKDLSLLIKERLVASEGGAVESASETAEDVASAFGCLIDLLVFKGVITLEEAMKTIGRQSDDVTLSEDSSPTPD